MKPHKAGSVLLVATLVLGCATSQTRPPETSPGPRKAGYRIAAQFTSSVPDAYEVLSGPIDTYRRLAINDRLRRLLDAYAREKSDESSGKTAELLVHLDRVTTAYRQIGSRQRQPPAAGRVVPASFDDLVFDDHDSRPEEITKRAAVALTVEVLSEGKTLLRESLTAEATQITKRPDIDPWAYDYSGVVDAALRQAVEALDGLVDRALAEAAKQ
jgi:hypothetical protein